MNNEAITTTADHGAPPARSTLLDRGSGFSFHAVLLLLEQHRLFTLCFTERVQRRTSVCQCLKLQRTI